jgi:hypothetical protein
MQVITLEPAAGMEERWEKSPSDFSKTLTLSVCVYL